MRRDFPKAFLFGALLLSQAQGQPCRIEVVERESGWPVPLVELRTTHHESFVTDNAGTIAFDLPELMGREVWFHVKGDGYGVPTDAFGNSGVRLTPEAGETLRVEVDRTIVARRLGRITGGGLFAESQKLGAEREWKESGILGCDSVQNAVHRGRMFWLWGDTNMARYPLGIFHGTSATTAVRPLGNFEPPLRLELDYFTDEEGMPRAIAPLPGEGPTWVSGYVSLPAADGSTRLVGSYVKITPPMDANEWGLCVWNDETGIFEPLRTIWSKKHEESTPPPMPTGHPIFWEEDGKEWVLFGNPLPTMRIPATFEEWQNPETWVVLLPQETLRTADGAEVKPHSGSIAWNPWRERWVTVFMEWFGEPSAFGEVWYAEAENPHGPWGPAVKVLSHENYTFYNVRIHPEFTPADSPVLLFEGTYTTLFADDATPTPRYDYNQIMYRLDLDDPQLEPAQVSGQSAPNPSQEQ